MKKIIAQLIKENLLILILSLIAIIPALPLINSGVKGVFYNIDPEVALIGNALSYIKNNMIAYRDHPGTPTILMISYSFWPIRLYTKFIEHINFIEWAYENLRILFLYTRYFYIFLFALSLLIFFRSVRNFGEKFLVPLFSCLLLFTFSFTSRLAGTVLSEGLSLLLISIWLLVLTLYLNKPSFHKTVILSLIGGIAVANKYNSFPILIASLLFPLFYKRKKIINRVKDSVYALLFTIMGFIMGTFPIRSFYQVLFEQVVKVAGQSGDAHGYGNSGLFDVGVYSNSFKILFNVEKLPSIVFLILLILALGTLIVKYVYKRKTKLDGNMVTLFVVNVVSIIFLAKYPISYYQFPNLVIMTFVASYVMNKLPRIIVFIACLLILPISYKNIVGYQKTLNVYISNSVYLEEHVRSNKTEFPTLWDFGPSEDFMKIWIRGWSLGMFDEQLKQKRPDILELKSDYSTVYLDANKSLDVFDACWDRLYIRDDRALVFLDIYDYKNLEVEKLENTGISVIKSNHCKFTRL